MLKHKVRFVYETTVEDIVEQYLGGSADNGAPDELADAYKWTANLLANDVAEKGIYVHLDEQFFLDNLHVEVVDYECGCKPTVRTDDVVA